MIRLAIVGGGPGGLMAAWNIKKKIDDLVDVTILEASERVGGKVLTQKFDSAPVLYEAGVAEIYGYTSLGHDPLHELIEGFGLNTVPMDSEAVMLDGRIIEGVEGMRKAYGKKTAESILKFRQLCASKMSPTMYYEGVGKVDNDHEWIWEQAEDILNTEVEDDTARRFFRVMARSDIASETHITNGLNALKNYLMDVDGYIDVYSIVNGNEQLIENLKNSIPYSVRYNSRVIKIDRVGEQYKLDIVGNNQKYTEDFDLVLICLPHNWLATLEWGNEKLRRAMTKHIAYFDRPAHYLRIATLFKTPFWDGKVKGSWFMSEAFGGCCVYIENTRHDAGGYGVLNWLIAGADALAYVNLSDKELLEVALDTLPKEFGDPREHFIEMKVHRWLSSVNAIPGGVPVRDVATNHRPDPKNHPGLFVVGDYLFDSTVNGLLDSSDIATDMLLSQIMRLRYESGEAQRVALTPPVVNPNVPAPAGKIDKTYFDHYRATGPYAEVWNQFTDPAYLVEMIRLVWKTQRSFKLLVAGSASGELVGALRKLGIDAWGVENNRYIYDKTPETLKKYNIFGSATDLPFKAGSFDFVYETCLAHIPPRQLKNAIAEFHRVVKKGVYFGSVTSDMNTDICDNLDLMRGVRKFSTWWEWSDLFFEQDFDLAIDDDDLLETLWERTLAANRGPQFWYDDMESLRYCFFKRMKPS